MDERLERHLCNLHNEVFEAAESRINTECSLIICEGISEKRKRKKWRGGFPHYMWGYIGTDFELHADVYVPSLYVRVYRIMHHFSSLEASSLIICEGISNNHYWNWTGNLFPHYMWGYIGFVPCKIFLPGVPSLYVRVYHCSSRAASSSRRSLIICEGISKWETKELEQR